MHDSTINGIRRRIGLLLALKGSLIGLAVWGFVWGTFVIAWRVSRHNSPEWLYWGAVAAAPIVVVTAWLAWRRIPSKAAVRALVDRQSACGGLLMTAAEKDLGSWERSMPAPAVLHVQWRGTKQMAAFGAAVVFVLVAFLAPQRLVSITDPGLEIGNDVHKLTKVIDMLKEEKILDQARVHNMKEKLKQIQEHALGREPKKTFDALDQVRESLSRTAQKAAEEAAKKTETLGKAEKLAEALRKAEGDPKIDDKIRKDALDELAKLVEKAKQEEAQIEKGMEQGKGLDMAKGLDLKGLDPDLLKGLDAGDLTPEQLKQLQDALENARGDIDDLLDRLKDAKLIDLANLKFEPWDPDGDGDDGDDLGLLLLKIRGNKLAGGVPMRGNGGKDEGPGHFPLAPTDGTSEDGAKFKEMALPPGSLASFKDSIKVGITKVQPKDGEAQGSKGGAIDNAAAGGGGANANVVLPQHRAAVQRFFARPKQ